MSSTSSFKKNLENKQRAKSLIEEVDGLKEAVNSIVQQLNGVLTELRTRSQEVEDVIKGIVDVVGADKVAESVVRIKNEEVEAAASAKKTNVLKAVEEGKLRAVTEVGINSVVIGTEKKADGTTTIPKENVVGVMSLNADLQASLIGKKTGETFELPNTNGNMFEILATYDIVEEQIEFEKPENL